MALNIPILSSLDTKGFDKAAREFAKLEGASAKTGYALKKAFLPAAAALGALGFAAVGAAKMASDLNEETSKSAVIFGDASTAIMDFSKTAATSLGQSQTEALKAAGTFGVLGTAAGLTGTDLATMATKFTTLATDLASFNNTSPEDAVLALGAGLRGEAEPLRRFGILLDDATLRAKALELGLVKSTKDALNPQTKSLAAQALILEQTSLQQGDFARTADGAANKQRILTAQIKDAKTNIGKGFLPVMAIAVDLLSKFAGFAKDNAPLIGAVIIVVGGLAAAIILANGAMVAWNAIGVVTTGINLALATSFTAVQVATVVGIATAIAGAGILAGLALKLKSSIPKTGDAAKAAETAAQAQKNYEAMLKTLKGTQDTTSTSTDKLTEAQKKQAAATAKAKAAAKQLAQELLTLKDALRDQMAAALEKANGILEEAQKKFDNYAKSVSESVTASYNFGNAQQTATENAKALADAIDKVGLAQSDVTKATAAVTKAQAAYNKAYLRGEPDNIAATYADLTAATDDYNAATRKLVESQDALTAAQQTPKTFLGNLKEQAKKVANFGVLINRLIAGGLNETNLQQVLNAGVDAGTLIAEELLNGAGNIIEANKLTEGLQDAADKVGQNSAKKFYATGVLAGANLVAGIQAVIDTYTISLDGIKTAGGVANLTTGFTNASNAVFANNGAAAAPAIDLSNFDFSNFDFSGIDLSGFSVGGLATLAAGGIVTGPTLAMIGEGNGPEAVIPLDRLGEFGGGGTNVTIQVNGGDPNAVVAALRTYMRQNGSIPIRVSNNY